MRPLVTALLLSASGFSQIIPPTVTWEQKASPDSPNTYPNVAGYLYPRYDPVSGKTWAYVLDGPDGTLIYSTSVYYYDSVGNHWTRAGGHAPGTTAVCADTSTWPGDRHPGLLTAYDGTRNRMWLASGINSTHCPSDPPNDMYFWALQANPTSGMLWTKMAPTTPPNADNVIQAAMAYDAYDDALIIWGGSLSPSFINYFAYCFSGGLGVSAICSGTANDWVGPISPAGGVQPPGGYSANIIYDDNTHLIYQFGGQNSPGNVFYNEVWALNPRTRTWAQMGNSPCAYPAGGIAAPAVLPVTRNPSDGLYYCHQAFGTGAPKTWQWNPGTDTWAALTPTGSAGPDGTSNITAGYGFLSAEPNKLIFYSGNPLGNPTPVMWVGTLTPATPTSKTGTFRGTIR